MPKLLLDNTNHLQSLVRKNWGVGWHFFLLRKEATLLTLKTVIRRQLIREVSLLRLRTSAREKRKKYLQKYLMIEVKEKLNTKVLDQGLAEEF